MKKIFKRDFNPRSPHGERLSCAAFAVASSPFQSTLPARGATFLQLQYRRAPLYFNPRSPHGERHPNASRSQIMPNFNPRSPHGERQAYRESPGFRHLFQSTLPARGATAFARVSCKDSAQFQSTLPARGATKPRVKALRFVRISIHAPRTGSDVLSAAAKHRHEISIHAPRTGSDGRTRRRKGETRRFQSTLPARGATIRTVGKCRQSADFNPRSPHGERHCGGR